MAVVLPDPRTLPGFEHYHWRVVTVLSDPQFATSSRYPEGGLVNEIDRTDDYWIGHPTRLLLVIRDPDASLTSERAIELTPA